MAFAGPFAGLKANTSRACPRCNVMGSVENVPFEPDGELTCIKCELCGARGPTIINGGFPYASDLWNGKKVVTHGGGIMTVVK